MSVEWHYSCASHTPPIGVWPDDIGNPSHNDMIKALDMRDDIISIPRTVWAEYQYELPSHVRWVHDHPKCALEIISEYAEVMHMIEAKP